MKRTNNRTQSELEQRASDVLLNEGVRIHINGIGKIEIKALKLGTLVKIAKEATKIDKEQGLTKINEVIGTSTRYAKPCAKIVAYAILNGQFKIWLLSRILAKHIYWNVNPKALSDIISIIISQSETDFFFACTTQLGAMNMMAPKITPETTVIGEQ